MLDPWNGSGTTTYVASHLGLEAKGLDINPVMVVVARARMLPPSEADALTPLASTLVSRLPRSGSIEKADPLCEWFAPSTASTVRQLERAIRSSTIGEISTTAAGVDLGRISGLTATLYVALFGACRLLTQGFRSTNPTWIREPRGDVDKIKVTKSEITKLFEANVRQMAGQLVASPSTLPLPNQTWSIELGDTTIADIPANSVDCILTSPPYCTRIDYTAATRIELAVLSPIVAGRRSDLSRDMIGSIRVPEREILPSETWGKTCTNFLESVRRHPSKASATYYYRTHLDYFDKMERSLRNLAGSLKKNGSAFLVVQDSYYKDVHNDLPTIISEIAGGFGLHLQRREDIRWLRSMARINRHTKVYKRPSAATESVLCFRKAN